MRSMAKVMLTMAMIGSFTMMHPIEVDAKTVFTGGPVFDSSRYKQIVEWIKQEQEKLNQLKAKLQHSLDTVKEAQQAIHSVKSSIDTAMKEVDGLRRNVKSVIAMSDHIIKLDVSNPGAGWDSIRYDREAIHSEQQFDNQKVANNQIISRANLEAQVVANGLHSIADANQSVIESLQKLGRTTDGLLDIQEVRTEMKVTETDTALQTAKAKAVAINTQLQEQVIQAENEKASNARRASDFYVTSDPDKRTEKETEELKSMNVDMKPGQGFVEF